MANWAKDFSYPYYRKLIEAARAYATPCQFREVPSLAPEESHLLVRHDVDCCLDAALRFAEMEWEMGLRSTYFVMMQSLLYEVADNKAVHILTEMGHEVGVHFDCPAEQDPEDEEGVQALVQEDCRRLEDILGQPVASVSFHRPVEVFLNGPLLLAGRVNAYAAELMRWYISDSRGSWRCGEPLREIQRARHNRLQLLTHPIWWGETHLSAENRLQEFFLRSTRGMAVRQRAIFDAILTATVPGIKRNGLYTPLEDERHRGAPRPWRGPASGVNGTSH